MSKKRGGLVRGGNKDVVATLPTGAPYRVGVNKAPPAGINIAGAVAGTTINTGLDFTQEEGMTLYIHIRDQAQNRTWNPLIVDVDNFIENAATGDTVDAYAHIFDNDYCIINLIDASAGIITIREVGRDMEYIKAELWGVTD